MYQKKEKKSFIQSIFRSFLFGNAVMDEPKTFRINRQFYKCQHGCWKPNWHRIYYLTKRQETMGILLLSLKLINQNVNRLQPVKSVTSHNVFKFPYGKCK